MIVRARVSLGVDEREKREEELGVERESFEKRLEVRREVPMTGSSYVDLSRPLMSGLDMLLSVFEKDLRRMIGRTSVTLAAVDNFEVLNIGWCDTLVNCQSLWMSGTDVATLMTRVLVRVFAEMLIPFLSGSFIVATSTYSMYASAVLPNKP